MNVGWGNICFFGAATASGIAGAAFAQPLIHENELAINVIVTVFSILAGFLVAIMTIMGEPGFAGRSWRANELNREIVFGRLVKQKWMFYLYLVTLGLIFAASLVGKQSPCLAVWLERIYLGTSITAFILSLRLPSALMKIQMARHEEVIKSKRQSAGIKE